MLKKLFREGKLDKIPLDFKEARKFLASARQDIIFAAESKEKSKNWSFVILYQAVIKIMKGLLVANGLRAKGESRHVTFLQAAKELIGQDIRDSFEFLDKMRRKRHRFIYDAEETITDADIEKGFQGVKQLFNLVRNYVQEKNPQGELFREGREKS